MHESSLDAVDWRVIAVGRLAQIGDVPPGYQQVRVESCQHPENRHIKTIPPVEYIIKMGDIITDYWQPGACPATGLLSRYHGIRINHLGPILPLVFDWARDVFVIAP